VSGDEMNIHVPQSEQSKAEIQEIMMIENNIISSQSNKPIIGIIQDALLGTFKITSRDTFITKELFMNIMMKLKKPNFNLPKPTIYKPKQLWTGKQVFDLILPGINLHRFTPQHMPEDTTSFSVNDSEVFIKNGKLLTGQICKKSIGATEGGIIHITWLDCGSTAANDFISQTQYLINCWLQETGFSIGAGDIFANEKSNIAVQEIVDNAKEKVNQIITIGKRNNLKQSSYEAKINQVLNNAVAQSGRQVELNTTLKNNIKTTVTGGSKGSILNIAQIMGCVGQQNVAGKRVALGYTNRVLPHYEENDIGPAAKGFVENSYNKGLTPSEFYYHAMGGREGVIDTAVKTSETGYIQRRLVKAMEDLQIFYDKTLRNSIGDVVQFVYGQDGMDATYLISENFSLWKTDKEFADRFIERSTPKDEIIQLNDIKENIKCTSLKSPVHIHRILESISIKYPVRYDRLSPKFIYDNLCETLKLLTIYHHKGKNVVLDKFNYNSVYVLHSMLRILLSSKQIRKVYKFTKEAFTDLLECIKYEFQRSLISTGEMVGTTSAQSLGEVTTQLCQLSETMILTEKNGYYFKGTMGSFCDQEIENNTENVIDLGNDSIALPLKENIYIVGVSDQEKTSWKRISEISRHKARGGMVKVTTRSGRTTTATLSHSFLKRSENKIVPILGSDLKVGHRIPVAKYIPQIENPLHEYAGHKLTKEFGWIIGAYLADGNVNEIRINISKVHLIFEQNIKQFCSQHKLKYSSRHKYGYINGKEYISKDNLFSSKSFAKFLLDNFKTGSYNKTIPGWVFFSNLEFMSGIISGFWDGDGNVHAPKCNIRSHSVNKNMLNDFCKLLAYFNIFGVLLEQKKDRTIESKYPGNYEVLYELNIPRKYAQLFKDNIGLQTDYKSEALDTIISYNYELFEKTGKYKEDIDMIPELHNIIGDLGKKLQLPSQSRTFGYFKRNKKHIGRQTLLKFIDIFQKASTKQNINITEKLNILIQAAYGDVVWDSITKLEYLPDPQEYVYDFTVPGNDSFMVDTCVLVHNTLNTFHNAGNSSKNATLGVPRLKEIINVSKNIKTPSMILQLKDEYNTKECAEKIAAELEFTDLKTVVESYKVINKTNDNYSNLYLDIPDEYDDEYCDLIIQYSFNKDILQKKKLSLLDISIEMLKQYQNILYINHNNENCKELLMDIYIIKTEEMEHINIERYIKVMCHKLQHECILQGSREIKQTYISDENDNFIIETDGSCIDLMMNNKYFDYTQIKTNDINNVLEVLGIEAARSLLLAELRKVIEFDGTYVNMRHFLTLVDTMTYKGDIMAITRHGINKANTGPLMKCSFEETVDVLTEAAIFSETDSLKGVTENIIVGKMSKVGTGNMDLLMNL